MIVALERKEGININDTVVCIVNSALGTIVEKIRNNAINDKSEKSYRILVFKQKLESTLNRIVNTTGLTRKLISVSTINKDGGNIYIDISNANNYIIAKDTSVLPHLGPNTIIFTIKLMG